MLLVIYHGILVYGEVSLEDLDHFSVIYYTKTLRRKGVPFTAMWLKFGNYDSQYDPAYITETANTASSIYFVTLVVM